MMYVEPFIIISVERGEMKAWPLRKLWTLIHAYLPVAVID